MKKIALAVAAVMAVAAVPAQAKPAHAGAKAKPVKPQKKCTKTQAVGFTAAGTDAAYADGNLTFTVAEANKHARGHLAGATRPTFSTVGAKVAFDGVTDADGNGVVDLADVAPTDRVAVAGKLTQPLKGCTGATKLAIQKIVVTRPVVEEPAEVPVEEQPVV